jgi:DNA-binding MarR family transcriptional regulator
MTSLDCPLTNPLESLLGYQIRRVSSELMAELARDLGDLGLKPSEASVLLLIRANPGVTQSEVGRQLAIQRANMAPLTARLDERGLIRRTRVDGRSHGLVVTDEGEALCHAALTAMEAHDLRMLGHLSKPARTALIEALAGLRREAGEG